MPPQAREHSLDELARGLASGSISRGRALRLMGAALVGGTLASLGIGEAGADDCKRNGKRCKKNSQCCSGTCTSNGTCQGCTPGTSCGPGGAGICRANASGAGTTCSCGDTSCAASCSECSGPQVCALSAGACLTAPFLCVTPCPTCLPDCDGSFGACTSNEQCCSNICEGGFCKPSVGFNCG